MLQCGNDFDFAEESLLSERDAELLTKHLHRDVSIVFHVVRDVDCSHSPGTHFALNAKAGRQA
jgi:hypothetical protein